MKQSRQRSDPKAIQGYRDLWVSHRSYILLLSFVNVMANEEPITMRVLTMFGSTKSGIDSIVIPSTRFILY